MERTDGLGRPQTATYDRGGRVVAVSDPRPATVTLSYDGLNRLTGVQGPGLTPLVLTYDVGSRRHTMQDGTGTTTTEYDGLDRPRTVAQPGAGTLSYGWDALGRETSVGTDTGAPVVSYEYDDAGRLQNVKRANALYAHAEYDPAGRLETVQRANGALTTYGYDEANRLISLETGVAGTISSRFSYVLDRAGRATQATELLNGTTRQVSYGYDGLGRLADAQETPGRHYGYTYDDVGNRLTARVDGVQVESRQYDAANGVLGWEYDGAGNLLRDDHSFYTYDALNRLTGVQQPDGSLVSGSSYSYNGDGVLVAETTGGQTTHYTLDTAGGLSERLGTTNGSNTTWYIRGWGQELSREDGSATVWYIGDRLGSVRTLLDASGAVTAGYNYDPYGVAETARPGDYGFTGEPQNPTNSLVQLRARWYNPATGSFSTVDPLLDVTGDAYTYAGGDPANGVDPSGLAQCAEGMGICGLSGTVAGGGGDAITPLLVGVWTLAAALTGAAIDTINKNFRIVPRRGATIVDPETGRITSPLPPDNWQPGDTCTTGITIIPQTRGTDIIPQPQPGPSVTTGPAPGPQPPRVPTAVATTTATSNPCDDLNNSPRLPDLRPEDIQHIQDRHAYDPAYDPTKEGALRLPDGMFAQGYTSEENLRNMLESVQSRVMPNSRYAPKWVYQTDTFLGPSCVCEAPIPPTVLGENYRKQNFIIGWARPEGRLNFPTTRLRIVARLISRADYYHPVITMYPVK